jgi:hypothetical protein
MAAIVYLDIDDEITSAAARLRALEERRIALVLPPGSRLATSRINFRLLAREAAARGKAIEIVTGDPSARALAASAGLPTHVSVAAFEARPAAGSGGGSRGMGTASPGGEGPAGDVDGGQRVTSAESPTIALTSVPTIAYPRAATPPAQVGRRPAPRSQGRRLAVFLVIVAVLAGAGVAGFELLPSATITLVPTTDRIGPIQLSVTAQPGVTRPDPVSLLVPATQFTFDLEASDTFLATGVLVTETLATGEVTFSSLNTGASNVIGAGSIVKTESGTEFRTIDSVTLPPAQIGIVDGKFVIIPSTRKVGIEALASGESGNVVAGAIVVVPEGENSLRSIVKNDAPTTGGSHTESPQVQQIDVDTALLELGDTISASFDERVAGATEVPTGTTLFPQTKVLGRFTPDPDPLTLVGAEVGQFELALSAQGSVLGVDPGPVSAIAEARLRAAVDEGFRLDEASVTITVGDPIVVGSVVTFPVSVRATQTREVDAAALLARVRGLGLPQARTVLGDYGEVTISVWPDWVTTIPDSESRVTFTVMPPSGAPDSPAPTASGVVTP